MNHVLDGGADPPEEGAVLREKGGGPLQSIGTFYNELKKTAELINILFGMKTAVGPNKRVRLGSRSPHGKGQF